MRAPRLSVYLLNCSLPACNKLASTKNAEAESIFCKKKKERKNKEKHQSNIKSVFPLFLLSPLLRILAAINDHVYVYIHCSYETSAFLTMLAF